MSVVLFQGYYKPFWSDPAQGTARGNLIVARAQNWATAVKAAGYVPGVYVGVRRS